MIPDYFYGKNKVIKIKKIPLYYPFLPRDLGQAVKETIESGWINTGPKAKEFEDKFKKIFGFSHALAVNSCTSALRLAYAVVGVGHNDEVITLHQPFFAWGLCTAWR